LHFYSAVTGRRSVRANVVKGGLSAAADLMNARRAAPAINCFNKLH
jgi:hypothetical protein